MSEKIRFYTFCLGKGYLISISIRKISSLDKVILYSVGRDTDGLIELLPAEVIARLEFCDRAAAEAPFFYQGKPVLPPSALLTTHKDYTIVVMSTQYGREIYKDLINLGVDMNRCIFNQIIFNPEVTNPKVT